MAKQTDSRNDDPGEDPRKELSILDLFIVGGRMHDEFSEDEAVQVFLEIHPEAREAEVRAELTRELEADDELERQHKARIERERARKAE